MPPYVNEATLVVADSLNVQGVPFLPVNIGRRVFAGRVDLNVSSIHSADDVRQAGDDRKCLRNSHALVGRGPSASDRAVKCTHTRALTRGVPNRGRELLIDCPDGPVGEVDDGALADTEPLRSRVDTLAVAEAPQGRGDLRT